MDFKEMMRWVAVIVMVATSVVWMPIVLLVIGCAPRSVRMGWDEQANKISGLEDDK